MKIKYLYLTLIAFSCFSFASNAQPWMNNIRNSSSFPIIKAEFEKYSKNKDITTVSGWKQYKRWEYFAQSRLNENNEIGNQIYWKLLNSSKREKAYDSIYSNGNWSFVGPSYAPLFKGVGYRRGVGRINCIAFDPINPETFFVGTPSGGAWKTTNNGNSWTPLTDNLGSLGISAIAIHPKDNNVIFIGTGDADANNAYSIGLLKSTDGGQTFQTTGLSFLLDEKHTISDIIINPNKPDTMFVSSSDGVYRSLDGGVSWSKKWNGFMKDLEFNPENPDIIIGSSLSYNASVFISTNGGRFFTECNGIENTNNVRVEIAVTPANPNIIYALATNLAHHSFEALYKSEDGGLNFNKIQLNENLNLLGYNIYGNDFTSGQGWYDLALAVSPVDENEIYVGGVNIWKSNNGGINWTLNSHWAGGGGANRVHADQHSLEFNPINNNLYSCNDGGLYRTVDGNSWEDISDGINVLQIYKFDVKQSFNEDLILGSQDNGSFLSIDNKWRAIIGGDGMECFFDNNDENISYASVYYGEFYRSTDNGEIYKKIKPKQAGSGLWITPFLIDPNNSNILYCAYNKIYKSIDKGENWIEISPILSSDSSNISELYIPFPNDSVIYCSNGTEIFVSKNKGENWSSYSFSNGNISSLVSNNNNPNKLWVSVSGYNQTNKVFYSENFGETFNNITFNLPNIPANCLLIDQDDFNAIYLGTDLGVYYTNDSLINWIEFNQNLPNVIVNDLNINHKTKTLYAGTFGRGIWKSPIFSNLNDLKADFACNNNTICLYDTLELYNKSSFQLDSVIWIINSDNNDTLKEINPKIATNKIGPISVSLIIFKEGKTDTLYRNNYINIIDCQNRINITILDTILNPNISPNRINPIIDEFSIYNNNEELNIIENLNSNLTYNKISNNISYKDAPQIFLNDSIICFLSNSKRNGYNYGFYNTKTKSYTSEKYISISSNIPSKLVKSKSNLFFCDAVDLGDSNFIGLNIYKINFNTESIELIENFSSESIQDWNICSSYTGDTIICATLIKGINGIINLYSSYDSGNTWSFTDTVNLNNINDLKDKFPNIENFSFFENFNIEIDFKNRIHILSQIVPLKNQFIDYQSKSYISLIILDNNESELHILDQCKSFNSVNYLYAKDYSSPSIATDIFKKSMFYFWNNDINIDNYGVNNNSQLYGIALNTTNNKFTKKYSLLNSNSQFKNKIFFPHSSSIANEIRNSLFNIPFLTYLNNPLDKTNNKSILARIDSININLDDTLMNIDFNAFPQNIGENENCRFINNSNSISTYTKWIFEGGLPNVSYSYSPSIKYDSAGLFDVTLISTNGESTDTLIKKDYIIVQEKNSTKNCDTLFYFNGKDPFYIHPSLSPIFNLYEDYDNLNIPLQSDLNSGWNRTYEMINNDTNFYLKSSSLFEIPKQTDNWLRFGPIFVPSEGVTIYWKHKLNPDYRDGYAFRYSNTGINPDIDFTEHPVLLFTDNDIKSKFDESWVQKKSEFTSSWNIGHPIYFAFQHLANSMDALSLDDILVVGCGNDVSINEFDIEHKYIIYPNPTKNEINIKFDKIYEFININISDISGRRILNKSYKNTNNITLIVSDLGKGLYFLTLNDRSNIWVNKFIIND